MKSEDSRPSTTKQVSRMTFTGLSQSGPSTTALPGPEYFRLLILIQTASVIIDTDQLPTDIDKQVNFQQCWNNIARRQAKSFTLKDF